MILNKGIFTSAPIDATPLFLHIIQHTCVTSAVKENVQTYKDNMNEMDTVEGITKSIEW